MNANRIKPLLAGLLIAALASPAGLAQNQPANAQTRSVGPPTTVLVFKLKSAMAHEVTRALKTICPEVRTAADTRTNSVILSGTDEALQLAQSVLESLDNIEAPPELSSHYFHTSFRVKDTIARMVRGVCSPVAEISYSGNLLVVRGTDSDHQEVNRFVLEYERSRKSESIVEGLGEPTTLQIAFYFIQAGQTAGGQRSGTPLPKSLAAVGKALEENGFFTPTVLAPVLVRVQNNGEYRIRSSASAVGPTAYLQLHGTASRAGSDGKTVDLAVEANLTERPGGDRKGVKNLLDLDTSISAPLGDFVVLSASPAPDDENLIVALVVRVTKSK